MWCPFRRWNKQFEAAPGSVRGKMPETMLLAQMLGLLLVIGALAGPLGVGGGIVLCLRFSMLFGWRDPVDAAVSCNLDGDDHHHLGLIGSEPQQKGRSGLGYPARLGAGYCRGSGDRRSGRFGASNRTSVGAVRFAEYGHRHQSWIG